MQTKRNILFLSTMLILVLSSCVKEPGEFQARLNVVSFISPGNGFQVYVSQTAPALGNHDNLEVTNAVVSIKNNETVEISDLTHVGNGIYTSPVSPLSGLDYEVRVQVPGFETAAATTYVPDLNDINVYETEYEEGDEEISLTFSANFKSSTSSSHFAYEVLYEEDEVDQAGSEVEEESPSSATTQGIKLTTNSYLLPIEDEISDGGQATINSVKTTNSKGEPTNIQNVSIRIVAVSPQYHAFLMEENEVEQTHYSSSHYLQDGIFSNFTDGAVGIFGGYNERTVKLID